MIGNSNDNTNFPHELLLTNRQVEIIRKAFANHLSTDIKLSKTKNDAIRRISWSTFRSITTNWITFNEECNRTIS